MPLGVFRLFVEEVGAIVEGARGAFAPSLW